MNAEMDISQNQWRSTGGEARNAMQLWEIINKNHLRIRKKLK